MDGGCTAIPSRTETCVQRSLITPFHSFDRHFLCLCNTRVSDVYVQHNGNIKRKLCLINNRSVSGERWNMWRYLKYLKVLFVDMTTRYKMDVIGDYEYNRKEILGHGAFAIVFKGRKKEVSKLFFSNVKRLVKNHWGLVFLHSFLSFYGASGWDSNTVPWLQS